MTLELPLNKILHGNALEKLKTLPDKSINCIVTSPPYWSLRNYQTMPVIWDADPNCKHSWKTRDFSLHAGRGDAQKSGKYSQQPPVPDTELSDAVCELCNASKNELGLEKSMDAYIKHLVSIFDECKRVLRDDGTVWIVMGDTFNGSGGAGGDYNEGGIKEGQPRWRQKSQNNIPRKSLCLIPHRFAIEMINHGWALRTEIVWHKGNVLPSSAKDRFTIDFERIFFFVKSEKYFFDTQYEPFQTHESRPMGVARMPNYDSKYNDKGFRPSQKFKDYVATPYTGQATKDYDGAKAQNPSDTKRRILASMKKKLDKMPPIGGVKKAGGDNPTYSGGTPDWGVFGRIKRAVWSINTKQFAGGHYAVFPDTLIETPIKAGCPKYICSKCGKPATSKYVEWRENTRPGTDVGKKKSGTKDDPNKGLHKSDLSKYRQQIYRTPDGLITCDCNAPMVGGIVLDCFMGTGTTAEVALKQRKRFVGIELNSDYIRLAEKRLAPFMPEDRSWHP